MVNTKYDYPEGMTSDQKKLYRRQARKNGSSPIPVNRPIAIPATNSRSVAAIMDNSPDYRFHTLPADIRTRLHEMYSQTDINRALRDWGKPTCFICGGIALPFKLDEKTFAQICIRYSDYPRTENREELEAFIPPTYVVHSLCFQPEVFHTKDW